MAHEPTSDDPTPEPTTDDGAVTADPIGDTGPGRPVGDDTDDGSHAAADGTGAIDGESRAVADGTGTSDDDHVDELPEDLDAAGFVGPYLFPNNNRRRVPSTSTGAAALWSPPGRWWRLAHVIVGRSPPPC